MEEKMRRESKVYPNGQLYVEKLFKQYDKIGAGAIHKNDMKKLVESVIEGFDDNLELDKLLSQHARRNKHTVQNLKTKQLEFQYFDDTIDFPSAMAIVVHFLAKVERKSSNAFAGQGLIRFADLDRRPSVLVDSHSPQKKRMF